MRLTTIGIGLASALAFSASVFGQVTNIHLISATIGDERAIQVRWESESNAVYRIDYASILVNSNTQLRTLYEDYPSHGTNTFWTDYGDYTQVPPVKRPRDYPMRYYRVIRTGTNTAASPFVSVTFPASNAVLSGQATVSVIATSALPVVSHKLYVDGIEMRASDDGTNYYFNTCEWANGPHVIFATAKAATSTGGFPGSYTIGYGRAVSAYIPVTFSNYVSQLNFSQPFFQPSLGQTQSVTAVFDAYSDWTLQIWDENSTAVRTATGSGYAMQFDWDGTGDGSVAIPDGLYNYTVSATGATAPEPDPGDGGPDGPPGIHRSSATTSASADAWYPTSAGEALMAGLTAFYLLPPPMPPLRIDGQWYSWADIFGPLPPIEIQVPLRLQESFLQSLSGQTLSADTLDTPAVTFTTPLAPTKPLVNGMKNAVGTFGVAYWTFPGGKTLHPPLDGSGFPNRRIQFDNTTFTSWSYVNVPEFAESAKGFANGMAGGGWEQKFMKSDTNLFASDLIRNDLIGYSGNNLFNQVNLGLFMDHGNFGTTLDFTAAASQTKQTYFPAGGNNPADTWIRLSDFRFGQSLKWMAILACNSLQQNAYQSMKNAGVLPIGDTNLGFTNHLHMLLGCKTYSAGTFGFGASFAKRLKAGNVVQDAWSNTGKEQYKGQPPVGIYTNTLVFKIVSWDTTLLDTLRTNTTPNASGDTLGSVDVQVYP